MITEQITFICDICGRKHSISKEEYMNNEMYSNAALPEGWRDIPPYGHTCTKCCEELDGVYARIHAPLKAREEAYGSKG